MQVDVSFAVNSPELIDHYGIAIFQVFLSLDSDIASKIGPGNTSLMDRGLEALADFSSEEHSTLGLTFEIAQRMLTQYGSDFTAVSVKYMNGLVLNVSAEAFAMEWLRRAGHADFRINPLERVVMLFSASKAVTDV